MTPADFDHIRALVYAGSGIVLDKDKQYLIETRLLPLARTHQFPGIDELLAAVRANPHGPLQFAVVEAMTTNETTFFRDLRPFEALRTTVLPQLIARRSQERRLTLWSAACSTGQEPYSLAMLLAEHFPQLANWTVSILATDLSPQVLERAKSGVFNQVEINRGLPAPMLVKYFRRDGMHWRIADELRRRIEFKPMNLTTNWPAMSPMDVVMVRNVLIYFDVPTKQTILGRVRRILRPDGYLFLGGAETTFNLDDGFERIPELGTATVFRQRGAAGQQASGSVPTPSATAGATPPRPTAAPLGAAPMPAVATAARRPVGSR